MSSTDFKFEDGKIYSLVTGDLVATVDEKGLKMQPGKNALTPKVKAFFESCDRAASSTSGSQALMDEKQSFDEPAAAAETPALDNEEEEVNTHLLNDHQEGTFFFGGVPGKGGTSAPAREKLPEKLPEKPVNPSEIRTVWDIPEDQLPEFSPALGVSTPEFKAFVKKHKFSKAQIIELVRRLEITQSKKEN